MVSLVKLRLQNFQAHKDTTLEFSPNFNCIVGPTRSGKSCVIRACDFLFYNDWNEAYQTFDSKESIITATLSNGVTIVRTKSDKVNRIQFILPDGKKSDPIEGFGLNLPREFIQTIGVHPIEVDADTSIKANVANQDDRLFLLYNDGGVSVTAVRTKVLSRLSGLHWIDYALKDLNKDRRDNSQEIQALTSTKKNLEAQLDAFVDVTPYTAKLAIARTRLDSLKQVARLIQKLESLVQRTTKWKESRKRLQELKSSNIQLSRFEQAVSLYERTYQPLRDMAHRLEGSETSIKNMRSHLQTLAATRSTLQQQLDDELNKQPLCPTCGSLVDPVKFQATV